MTEPERLAEHAARREQAEARGAEMEARYDRLTLTVARMDAEIARLRAAVDWRAMFIRYVELIEHREGITELEGSTWTPEQHAAIRGLPGWIGEAARRNQER